MIVALTGGICLMNLSDILGAPRENDQMTSMCQFDICQPSRKRLVAQIGRLYALTRQPQSWLIRSEQTLAAIKVLPCAMQDQNWSQKLLNFLLGQEAP